MSRIIVGIDRSAPAAGALMWAGELAMRSERPLVLVHVLGPDQASALEAHEQHAASMLLENAALPYRDRSTTTPLVLQGDAVLELASLATADDVVVVGSHKTGYTRGRALTPLAGRLAGAVACTLLVIPDAPAVRDRSGIVLAAPATVSDAAVRLAVTEAHDRHQRLTIVSAVDETHRHDEATRLDELAARIHDLDDTVQVERRVLVGRTAAALLDLSRTALLLILDSGLPDLDVTVHDILTNPVCAVWVVPRDLRP